MVGVMFELRDRSCELRSAPPCTGIGMDISESSNMTVQRG